MPKPHTPQGGFPGAWKTASGYGMRLVARVVQNGGRTQKRQCHARESGHPDLAARAGVLDARFRGNDTTLKDLILNDSRD